VARWRHALAFDPRRIALPRGRCAVERADCAIGAEGEVSDPWRNCGSSAWRFAGGDERRVFSRPLEPRPRSAFFPDARIPVGGHNDSRSDAFARAPRPIEAGRAIRRRSGVRCGATDRPAWIAALAERRRRGADLPRHLRKGADLLRFRRFRRLRQPVGSMRGRLRQRHAQLKRKRVSATQRLGVLSPRKNISRPTRRHGRMK
jgi:hypothetical protein